MLIPRLFRMRAAVESLGADPTTQALAAETVARAYLAEGLVGIKNPLARRRRRTSLFSIAFMAFFGAAFLWGANLLATSTQPYEDGLSTAGVIVDLTTSTATDSDGNRYTSCQPVVQYTVDGITYRVESPVGSSSFCDDLGMTRTVSYRSTDPGDGLVLLEEAAGTARVFTGIGLLTLFLAVVALFLRVCYVLFGISFWTWSRRLGTSRLATTGSNWLPRLRAAWAGRSESEFSTFTPDPTTKVTPAPDPGLPVAPPPGWYPHPQAPTGRRWWDGDSWTDATE